VRTWFSFHQQPLTIVLQIISDPAKNNQLLTDQLRSLGLYAAPTLGDGNCLFRALSDQLHGTPSHHLRLRADICDWIEAHKVRYEPFCEDERGLGAHLRCMREQGASFL
jgi:OTU domain-containing protein 3